VSHHLAGIGASLGIGRVYPTFLDPELADPGRAYYGDHYPRLRTIKPRYDPGAVFGSQAATVGR
jgi:berberine-like enzyme